MNSNREKRAWTVVAGEVVIGVHLGRLPPHCASVRGGVDHFGISWTSVEDWWEWNWKVIGGGFGGWWFWWVVVVGGGGGFGGRWWFWW